MSGSHWASPPRDCTGVRSVASNVRAAKRLDLLLVQRVFLAQIFHKFSARHHGAPAVKSSVLALHSLSL